MYGLRGVLSRRLAASFAVRARGIGIILFHPAVTALSWSPRTL